MPAVTAPDFRVREARWFADREILRQIRRQLGDDRHGAEHAFADEDANADAVHALACAAEDDQPIGAGRLRADGQIDALAVLPSWRGRGVGSALLATLSRFAQERAGASPWLLAPRELQGFFQRLGYGPMDGQDAGADAATEPRLVPTDSDALALADLRARYLGLSKGRVPLEKPDLRALAIAAMVSQAHHCLEILSPDLEPVLYDREEVLENVRALVSKRRGRLPVRLLVSDVEATGRRGYRLLQLARQFTSDVQIRALSDADLESCPNRLLLADASGYCLTREQNPQRMLVDFADGGENRRLRRQFDRLWEQSEPHPALRRLYL